MSNRDGLFSRPIGYLLRLPKDNRVLAGLLAALLMSGCYAFVDDAEPPEWNDPAGADAQLQAIAAGTGGPGASVFNAKCAVCHQMNGQGIPGVYPSLVGSQIATGDPALPIRIVLHGFQGPIERDGKKYNGVMQPWKNDLNDQEIADVLNFIRTNWGNAAAEISAEMVKEVRDATKSKAGAYTEEQLLSTL
ncbi:MAG: cytochrome C oxidase Cbb3 [Ignavibacteria bacterium]|nr:MAG: cytochrome C oxidase Cbb3 [Ignavibacteria bacterium]